MKTIVTFDTRMKLLVVLALCILLPASLLVINVNAPLGWHIASVDPTSGTDTCDITLDSNGFPHISYMGPYDASGLRYAKWTASGWISETVDSGDVGRWSSIALDSNDNPHISYCNWTEIDLKYARWNPSLSGWSIETVDSIGAVGVMSSLALDSNDNPHISYLNWTGELKYASWTGSMWNIETVDTAHGSGGSSLAIDSIDNPHISYFSHPDANGVTELKYASWTGSAWAIETVESLGSGNTPFSSLALDSNGNPHISYYDVIDYGLKYARWTGSVWAIETVDSYGDYSSIALDSNDNPHISYRDYPDIGLNYARWTGSVWRTEYLEDVGCGWVTSSIALDPEDNPHIAYTSEWSHAGLAYATVDVPLNMWSSDSFGNAKDVFVPGESVFVTAPCPRTYGISVTLYVVADKATWNDGDLLTDVSGGTEILPWVSGPIGSIQTAQVWAPPLATGDYDIVMDKDNDGVFDAGLDLVDSVLIAGFNVVPEVSFGTFMIAISMIFALIGYMSFKRFHLRLRQ